MSMAWLLPERFPLSENISFGLQTQKDTSFSHAGKKTKHPEIIFYLNISLTHMNSMSQPTMRKKTFSSNSTLTDLQEYVSSRNNHDHCEIKL